MIAYFLPIFCLGVAMNVVYDYLLVLFYLKVENLSTQFLLGNWKIPKLQKQTFFFCAVLFVILLILSSFKFLAVWSLPFCVFFYFVVYGQLGYLGRKTNLYPFILLFLWASLISKLSVDYWAVLFIKTTLALVYLSAFVQKVRGSRSDWVLGKKMKNVIQYHDMINGTYFQSYFDRIPISYFCIGIITLTFEATFWISLIFPTIEGIYALWALFFHLGALVLFKINYFRYYLPILIIYFL